MTTITITAEEDIIKIFNHYE